VLLKRLCTKYFSISTFTDKEPRSLKAFVKLLT
jgi:hypothetical protein